MPLLGLHQEAHGLLEALQWLEANCKIRQVDQAVLLQYHQMALKQDSVASSYRQKHVRVVGSSVPRPEPARVPPLMKQFEMKLLRMQGDLDLAPRPASDDVLKVAIFAHERVGLVHPFEDGNGRVARLAMNHVLRRYGQGYVVFPPLSESPELMAALQDAHRGDAERLLALARTCVVEA